MPMAPTPRASRPKLAGSGAATTSPAVKKRVSAPGLPVSGPGQVKAAHSYDEASTIGFGPLDSSEFWKTMCRSKLYDGEKKSTPKAGGAFGTMSDGSGGAYENPPSKLPAVVVTAI